MTEHTEFFRRAIDLNRYSNGVATRIIRAYNDVIIEATEKLAILDPESISAYRLRTILVQLKESLNTWAGDSTLLMTEELQGLAILERDFMVQQLESIRPPGAETIVRSVEISPEFARAVVTTDPTSLDIVSLSDDLPGAPRTFAQITVADGTTLTLPNGEIIRNAFNNMTINQAQIFSQTIRNGLLMGDSVEEIVRTLKGRLAKGSQGTIDQLAQKGGAVTVKPTHQIRTIVRTSVTQVTDAAREEVALANSDITQKYVYRALLDSKTTPLCRSLDGNVYSWGEGPVPPLHWNCRSIRTALIKGAEEIQLSRFTDYGTWLKRNPGEKLKVFKSPKRVAYYDYLEKKYGPKDALVRFVRSDGAQLTLKQLAESYPDVRV